jgi:holo-[acyl-carrier protein] synthase
MGALSVIGVGTDLVEIDRLSRSLTRAGFAEEVFSASERSDCQSRAWPAQHFAARFAAKEAFLKAVGRGLFAGVPLNEIEVVGEVGEAPALKLGPGARAALDRRGGSSALVSLTHAGNLAMAFVVVQ